MKKRLKYLYIIPLYIMLIVLSNINTIINNISGNMFFLSNIDYVNVINVVCCILFLIVINKKDIFNSNKKLVLSMLGSIYIISCINGITKGEHVDSFILLYLFIVYNSFVFSLISKRSFEISLLQSTSLLILTMIVLAIFNLLSIVKYLIIIYIVLSAIIILFKKAFNNENIARINSYSIVFFSLLFIISIVGGINRYVHTWDEFSHWAFDAKSVITYDKLSTSEEIMSRTRSYPPVITIWHYFISIFSEFNEHHLYMGLGIFISIFIMSVFSINVKTNLKWLLFIIIYSACFLFGGVYGYDTLYADLPLAAIFASTFILYLKFKDDNKSLNNNLAINFAILILTKPSGFILVFTFFSIMLFESYFAENNSISKFRNIITIFISFVKKYWKLIVSSILVFLTWNIYVKICNVLYTDFYDARILPDILQTSLSYKLNKTVVVSFLKNLVLSFDETIISGIINISLYQFIIMVFSLLYIVNYLDKRDFKLAFKQTLPYILGYFVFFILTLLSIFAMFSVYETEKLASFGRYLNNFNYAFLIYICTLMIKKSFLENKTNKLFTLIIFVTIIINIPFNKIMYFISDYSSRTDTINFSYSMNEKFDKIKEKIPQDSMVYVIDQNEDDGIMAMWYSRYYLFPRKVNASSNAITWKVKTEKNKDDLKDWGLTAQTFESHLVEYKFDYLYLYSYDDELLQNINYMIKYNDITDPILFKIQTNENNVSLIPVL